MNRNAVFYKENFPDYLCVKHKVAPYTEKRNFHLHSQLEIIFTLSDNLVCYYENAVVRIPKYSFLLLNTMCLHHVDSLPDSGVCDRYVITFSADFIQDLQTSGLNLLGCFLNQDGPDILLTAEPDRVPYFTHLLDTMEEATQSTVIHTLSEDVDERLSTMTLKYELAGLLTELNRLYLKQYHISTSLKHQRGSQMVSDICRYIEEHLEEEISVDELAHRFAVSKTFLYNLTKEYLHASLSDYISLARINRAKAYLVNSDYSVEIISQKVGYGNISSFSRFFKSQVGLSPLKYRQNGQ